MDPDSTRAVIEAHIECRRQGRLDDDLDRHYAPHVTLLSAEGTNHGHDGVRRLAAILHRYAPEAEYRIHALHVDGPYALELWSARSPDSELHDGADTFLVEDGRIVLQTIHFSQRQRSHRPSG